MKDYRRKFLAYQEMSSTLGVQSGRTSSTQPNAANTPKPALSRKQRRRNAVFNRKLKRRLEKDGTPVRVETQADGGIHVTVSKEELEMRHGEPGEDSEDGESNT